MKHIKKDIYEDLKKDIYDELFYWIDKKGSDYFFDISDFFYKARSGLLTGTLANLSGSKILIGVDSAKRLDEIIRKYSLMYDYVIIRHRTFTPIKGVILDSRPVDFTGFGKPEYLEKYEKEMPKGKLFPHLRSSPHRSQIKEFHDWVSGAGRPWLEDGNVIYAPFLISTDIEKEIYKDEISFSTYYFESNIFPAEDERFVAFSDIVKNLNLPSIKGCSVEWLKKFREDNTDSLNVFREYLIKLINESKLFEGDKTKYTERVKQLSNTVNDELFTLGDRLKKQKRISTPKNKDIAFDLIPIAVSFFTGLPPWATALSLIPSARHFVKSLVEGFKNMKEFKNSPLYIMTKLIKSKK